MQKLRGVLFSIFVFLFLLISQGKVFAQKISFTVTNIPLSEVLHNLSIEHDAKIAFDSDLASKIIVSGSFTNATLFDAISVLLTDTPLEAIIINDVIVVRPRKADLESLPEETQPPPPVEYRIFGLIKDRSTHEHLPYASISIKSTSKGVSTNSDGYFTLFTNSKDTLELIVSYLGYMPLQVKVFPPSQTDALVVHLEMHTTFIADAQIVKRQSAIVTTESTPGMLRWNSNRNTDMPMLNGLDIAAPLQLLPGIDGTTESLSGLIVRKLPSDKNLFIFDGFTIYHIDHLFGAFTSFNSKSVKDIRVFKGGFDARWGGRASSVIEITGKSGNANKFSADVGGDLLSADVLVEGPLGDKFTYLFAARRSFTDKFRSRIYYQLMESARSDFDLTSNAYPSFLTIDTDEPSIVYYDINSKLSYKSAKNDLISLSLFTANDAMLFDRQTQNQTLLEESDWGSGGLGMRWARSWNTQYSQVLTVGASRYDLNFFHADTTLRRRQFSPVIDTINREALIDNWLTDVSVNLNQSFKVNTRSEFQFGAQANWVDLALKESALHVVNSVALIDTARVNSQSMVLTTLWGQHVLNNDMIKSLKYGGRLSYYGPTKKPYFEPRVQLSVNLSAKSYLKFSAGRYYQFVNQVLTFSSYSFRRLWTVSDGDKYPVVKSNHFTVGGLTRLPKGFTIDLELYSRRTHGITTMQTVLKQSTSGARVTEQQIFYTTSNDTKGLDLIVLKEFSRLQVWLAYTLSKSMNQADNINRSEPYPSLYDQRHEIKFAGTGEWKGWGVGFAAIFGTGKPWDEPLFTGNLRLAQDYEKNANRLPPYLRVDFGVSYTRTVKSITLKTGINGFNVFNWSNKLARVYSLSNTPMQTYLQTGTPLVYSDLNGMNIAQMVYFNVKF